MTGGFTSPTRGRARESSTSIVTAILVDEMTGADPRPTNDLYHAIVLLDALKPGLNAAAVQNYVIFLRVPKGGGENRAEGRGCSHWRLKSRSSWLPPWLQRRARLLARPRASPIIAGADSPRAFGRR